MIHNDDFYELNNELKIVIYGVNEQSRRLAKLLLSMNYEIILFLDRRAEELKEVEGIHVQELSDFTVSKIEKKICIIIALNNAMQHDEIAADLFDKGINKIIFVPMEFKYYEKFACQLREAYNQILLGNIEEINEIPYYETLICDSSNSKDVKSVWSENEKYLTVKVMADIVYTSAKEELELIGRADFLPMADMPLMMLRQFQNMFEYFWGGAEFGNLQEYLSDYGVNSCNYTNSYTDEQIILQRAQLYELWNEHFSEGLEFFVLSAPLAKWNDNGYFNLTDGHHRLIFLLKKGLHYLPIRISRQDWDKWRNVKVIDSMDIEKDGVDLVTPIPNPYFQKRSFYNKTSIIESMLHIQKNLPRDLYKDKRVLCIDSMYGYYGFNLRRMGAENVLLYAQNSEKKRVMEQLSQLYGLQNIDVIEECVWTNLNHLSLVLLIGGAELISYKQDIIKKFRLKEIDAVLISLSEDEMGLIGDNIRINIVQVSKVFQGTQMFGIYLLNRDR